MLRAGGPTEDWIILGSSHVVTVTVDGHAGFAIGRVDAGGKPALKHRIQPHKLQNFRVMHFVGQVTGQLPPAPTATA